MSLPKSGLLAAWCFLAALLPAAAASYTLSIPVGFSLIANQLDHGGNTLDEILTGQAGDQVFKWDNATCQYVVATFDEFDLLWTPNLTLGPGEGAWYRNTGAAFNQVFTGTPHVPVLPVSLPTNCCALVSRQTNGIGTYDNIVGTPPATGVRVYRFTAGGFQVSTYDADLGGWDPAELMANVGEAVWICCPACPEPPLPFCLPPQVTVQPANQTVAECSCVTFGVATSGDAPLTYQWQRNGGNIPGANGSSYTLCPVSLADNGAVFRVIITNACGSMTSANATLTVLPDLTPPHLVSVTASCCDDRIYVLFDEMLNAADALNVFNYDLSGGVTIHNATLLPDGRTVCLDISPLTPGATYTLMAANLRDCAGNLLSPNPAVGSFTAPVFTKGYVLRQWWFNVPGNTLPALLNLPAYPNAPDRQCYTNLFELNAADETDNYGARLVGWFCPPESGSYQFYLASDDQSELYLSTDCQSANKVLIAREPIFAGRREWTGAAGGNRNAAAPENQSATLFPGGLQLVADQRYYIEAILKEGAGGDHLAVAVQRPGSPPPVNGSTPISGQFLGACLAATGTVTIIQQPAHLTVSNCCNEACFRVSATGSGACGVALGYQWRINSTPIPGASGTMFCLTNVTLADNGAQIQVVVSSGGSSVTSQVATLTVIQDITPPVILSASVDCLSNKIALVFSECLEPGQAQEPFNYVISPGVTIQSVVLSADGRSVCLFTSPLLPNTDYVVTANGLLDQCGNGANELAVTVRCPCELPIRDERLTCATNAPGKLNYSFDLQNNTGVPVKYLFLVPTTNCFTITPGIITFQPPLSPGQITHVSAWIGHSGDCPTNLCFFVAAHDSNLVNCCSTLHCVDRIECPDCAPGSRLNISLSNGNVVISWTGPSRLQCAAMVIGPWSDVVGATNPYTTQTAGPHKFYRLVCP